MRNYWEPRLQYSVAAVAVGGASLAYGIYKDVKANKDRSAAESEARNTKRPFERISDEYFQNLNIGKENATMGLPVDVKNYLEKQRKQGYETSSDAMKQGGAGINDFSKLNKVFDDSLVNESAHDAEQHFANIQYLIGLNKDMAGQKTTQWGVNEYQPFESKLKELQDRQIAAQQNANQAGNDIIGSLAAISTSINSARNSDSGGGGGSGSGGDPTDTSVAKSDTSINTSVDTSTLKPKTLQTPA